MVTLYYCPIPGIVPDEIIKDIDAKSPDQIIIFNELEWELRQVTKEFVDYVKSKNIELKIIFGSFSDEYYVKYCEQIGLPYKNLIFWPTYWISWSEMCLKWVVDYKNYNVNTDFKYKLISLNNKSHVHRQALIDHLAKYNLIENNVVSWHRFNDSPYKDYEFKYFHNNILTINDDFVNRPDSFYLPEQWHQSFLHVVGEATSKTYIISEKTMIPLMLKKPFFCISKKGYNRKLKDLGFVLYDEIIDYSYDDLDDLTERADRLCYSISQLGNNYKDLYNLLKPKIEHNYQRFLEIIHDINFVPDIVRNNVKNADENFMSLFTTPRYIDICKKYCND